MKASFILPAAFLTIVTRPLSSAVISLAVSQWTDSFIDIDNDGIEEIEGGSFSDTSASFLLTVDAVDTDYAVKFPIDETSVFGVGGRFSNRAELRSGPVWTGPPPAPCTSTSIA